MTVRPLVGLGSFRHADILMQLCAQRGHLPTEKIDPKVLQECMVKGWGYLDQLDGAQVIKPDMALEREWNPRKFRKPKH